MHSNVFSIIILVEIAFQQVYGVEECYGQLGCYHAPLLASQGNPLNPTNDPIKYLVFTCDRRTISVNLTFNATKTEIDASGFDSTKQTKFIIHGYLNGFYKSEASGIGVSAASEWPSNMRDYIFEKLCPDVQVIGVDWAPGASPTNANLIGIELGPGVSPANYFQAVVNTVLVGDATAYLIKSLVSLVGANVSLMHLAGHSLGAHVCAFTGIKITNPKLYRITALDSALPGFFADDSDTNIDSTDAQFVNTIHTGSGIITTGGGLLIVVGAGYEGDPRNRANCDFYINGGSQQPGCYNIPPPSSLNPLDCDHQRAPLIPMADPTNGCQLVAYNCDSYEAFVKGNCADCGLNNIKCKPLEFQFGYWDNSVNQQCNAPPNNKYYIKTSGSTPFCIFHYQIIVYSNIDLCSSLIINIKGTSTVMNNYKNGQCSGLLTTQSDITPITSVTISNTIGIERVSKVQIIYMSNIDASIRQSKSVQFCDELYVSLTPKTFDDVC